MDQQLKMAVKLYECRDTAKRLLKDDFVERLKPYKDLIQAVMKVNKVDEIPALLKISQTHAYQNNPMGQMMFMAATVELIEPSV